MNGRFFRFAIVIVLLLLAAQVAEPYVTRFMFADTTPRLVTARGNLSEAEQTIVGIFQQVSPSVVQVVGRQDSQAGTRPSKRGGRGRTVRDRFHMGWRRQHRHQQSCGRRNQRYRGAACPPAR